MFLILYFTAGNKSSKNFVDLADLVRHWPDHEAADGGEGHRVGEVGPVLRRLRVALAEDCDDGGGDDDGDNDCVGGGDGEDGDLAKEQQTPNPPPQDPDASPCFALKWFQVMRKTTTI